jgi:hypothetical protein
MKNEERICAFTGCTTRLSAHYNKGRYCSLHEKMVKEPQQAREDEPVLQPQTFDVTALTQILHSSRKTITNKIKNGDIHATRVGARAKWIITQGEVDRLLGTQKEAANRRNETVSNVLEEHLEQIRTLLKDWRRDIRISGEGFVASFPVMGDRLFPYVLQHCPQVTRAFYRVSSADTWALVTEHRILHDTVKHLTDSALMRLNIKISDIDVVAYTGILSDILKQLDRDVPSVDFHPRIVENLDFRPGIVETLSRSVLESLSEAQRSIYDSLKSDPHLAAARQMCASQEMLIRQLNEAIEVCLTSHDYQHFKCDWCP